MRTPATPTPLAAAETILALAVEQSQALYAERWDEFTHLADQRDALLAALSSPQGPTERTSALALLTRATAIDEQNRALVQALLAETERELRLLHQGHNALQGYGRPASNHPSVPSQLNVTG